MIKFENPTTTTFSYDFLALTNLAYDVTLECITQNATHGYATFDYEVVDNSMPPNPPFLLFVVPFLFCSWVKLNQLSPLVSLTTGLEL